jgi:hypothetical protein
MSGNPVYVFNFFAARVSTDKGKGPRRPIKSVAIKPLPQLELLVKIS